MRQHEFTTFLAEKAPVGIPQLGKLPKNPTATINKPDPNQQKLVKSIPKEIPKVFQPAYISKATIEGILKQSGFNDVSLDGNKIEVLTDIPAGEADGEYRKQIMQSALSVLKKAAPKAKPEITLNVKSSIGGIVFGDGSPCVVLVKAKGGKGGNSAGLKNEAELAKMLSNLIKKHKTINVTFIDPTGKKMSIKNCNQIDMTGKATAGRKKADVVLSSTKGHQLPISIKKLNADSWESGDSLFGKEAGDIVRKLIKKNLVSLTKVKEVTVAGKTIDVMKLSKEIVVEPSEEQAMNAIFGSDLLPSKGGVAIQTFKPEHFVQDGNNIMVNCHAIITKKSDIPESHLMVWVIRNDSDRTGSPIGIPGLRVLGNILSRGIGAKGQKIDKDAIILVDINGNVVPNDGANRIPTI
jgi:hypothetical protein